MDACLALGQIHEVVVGVGFIKFEREDDMGAGVQFLMSFGFFKMRRGGMTEVGAGTKTVEGGFCGNGVLL